MMSEKRVRPRMFGKRDDDGGAKEAPERAGQDAPISGMFANSVKGLSQENARLRDQLASSESLIQVDPDQVEEGLISDRATIDEQDESFLELKASIEQRGQDQPVIVRQKNEGRGYELIAGRRRVAACRALGLKVLARVQQLDDRSALGAMWAENNVRLRPAPLELGAWVVAVMHRFGLKQADLIDITGYKRPQLSKLAKLGEFPDEIRRVLIDPRDVAQNAGLDLIDKWNDRSGRKAIEDNLGRAEKLNSTSRQVAFLLSAKSDKSQRNPVSERITLKDSAGQRRGSVVRTERSLKIEIDQAIPDGVAIQVVQTFERLLKEGFPQETPKPIEKQ